MDADSPVPHAPDDGGDRESADVHDQSSDDALDDQLDDALAHNDYITLSRLAFAQSLHFHRLEQYSVAIEYSGLALDSWLAHFGGHPDAAPAHARSTALRMVNAAAAQHFNQSHFNTTIDLIHQARRLAALMPPTALIASTEWNTALMERWRRDFPRALQHALRIIEIFRKHGDSSLDIARAHLFAAPECAIAPPHPPWRATASLRIDI